jgi:hypothetical protein
VPELMRMKILQPELEFMKLVAEKNINENPAQNVNDQTMVDVNSSAF